MIQIKSAICIFFSETTMKFENSSCFVSAYAGDDLHNDRETWAAEAEAQYSSYRYLYLL